MSDESPFDRWGIDPLGGPAAITERLRELAEDATSDAERAEIRAAWEQLTLHPLRRFEAALDAFPETRPPLGGPPQALARHEPSARALDLDDVLTMPRVEDALGEPSEDERALLGPLRPSKLIRRP